MDPGHELVHERICIWSGPNELGNDCIQMVSSPDLFHIHFVVQLESIT